MGLFSKKINDFTDEELIALFIDKKKNKYIEELYKRYSSKLIGYFYRLYEGDLEKAQDSLHDLFIKVIDKKHQFDPSKKFYTWIFTIASNLFKSDIRKLENKNKTYEFPIDKTPVSLEENLYDKEVFKQLLRKSINNLTTTHKVVFILRYNEDFSIKEIAEITDTSEGTVKSRLFYATKNISEKMKEFSKDNNDHLFKIY